MAKKDALTKKYMGNPAHFADFFNGFIYGGKEVIRAEDLSEIDTGGIAVIPYVKGNKKLTVQKYRDILKKAILMKSDKACYIMFGIENQTDVHYAMPVRNMLYDALAYSKQVEEIAQSNRENGLYTDDGEFLSGFTAKDKLIPVITATVYWGTKSWDGPTTLKEMLIETDSNILKLVYDYGCNLFSIIDAENFPAYKTELNELFALLRVRNDCEALRNLVTGEDAYKDIDSQTAEMIREFANIKLPRKTKEGRYNMCKAILDLEQKNQEIGKEAGEKIGREAGEKIGREAGEKIGKDRALVEAIKNLMDSTQKSFRESCLMLKIPEADMLRYEKMMQ